MAARDETIETSKLQESAESQEPATVTRLVGKGHAVLRTIDNETARQDAPRLLTDPKPPRRLHLRLWSYVVLVLLPVLASIWYFNFVATDQFIAEARFAVRSLSTDTREEATSGPSSGLSTNALTQDAYVVASFIHSSEILRRLNEKVRVASYFSDPSIDGWSRLPEHTTAEGLLKYWSKQVTTYIDGPSGIITLYVRTFSPETAQQLAELITQESETLINELAERARVDIVARSQAEVEKTESNYRKVLSDLNAYQNASGILDPTAQAGETGTLLIKLMGEKLEIDSRLFVVSKSLQDDSPSVQQLVRTQTSLQEQIDKLRSELANSSTADDNLSKSLRRFSELDTDRLLAAGLYEAARKNLAAAQAEAISKSVYVTVFVPPGLPEESRYPARLFTPLMVFVGLTMAWLIGNLAWASVEDHTI